MIYGIQESERLKEFPHDEITTKFKTWKIGITFHCWLSLGHGGGTAPQLGGETAPQLRR